MRCFNFKKNKEEGIQGYQAVKRKNCHINKMKLCKAQSNTIHLTSRNENNF